MVGRSCVASFFGPFPRVCKGPGLLQESSLWDEVRLQFLISGAGSHHHKAQGRPEALNPCVQPKALQKGYIRLSTRKLEIPGAHGGANQEHCAKLRSAFFLCPVAKTPAFRFRRAGSMNPESLDPRPQKTPEAQKPLNPKTLNPKP